MMSINQRHYDMRNGDFLRVSAFFRRNYVKYLTNGMWPHFAWEHAHSAPWYDYAHHYKNAIYEDDGTIVGLATYECHLGELFMFTASGYEHLQPAMLDYGMNHLYAINDAGQKELKVEVCEFNSDMRKRLENIGFTRAYGDIRTVYDYSKGLPEVKMPNGFSIVTLAEEQDYAGAANAVWHGFDHEDDNSVDDYLLGVMSKNFREDLTFLAKAPDGDYCSYACIWLDADAGYAYLEPLSTVPKYRRMGLARGLLYEAINRTAKMGAAYLYGGSREFYYCIGFEPTYERIYYKKSW
ncbi:MAG: GNAT family N-acetyltransferase [Anaerolineaceae bacterium]|nr:GNAT family N-acetyltransferase [Anaerolineaceae bacterium]